MSESHIESDAVRDASDQFYNALDETANGDASSMVDVWSHEDDVTTKHPIAGREEGFDAIKESREEVISMSEGGEDTRTDQLIRLTGNVAYELYTESAWITIAGYELPIEVRATNVYRKKEDEWKVVHHHANLHAEFAGMVANMEESA